MMMRKRGMPRDGCSYMWRCKHHYTGSGAGCGTWFGRICKYREDLLVMEAPRGEGAGQGRVDYHHNHNFHWSPQWWWESTEAVLLAPHTSSSRLAQGNPRRDGRKHRAKWSPQWIPCTREIYRRGHSARRNSGRYRLGSGGSAEGVLAEEKRGVRSPVRVPPVLRRRGNAWVRPRPAGD